MTPPDARSSAQCMNGGYKEAEGDACLAAAGKALGKEGLQGALDALRSADLCAAGTELPPLRIVGDPPCC